MSTRSWVLLGVGAVAIARASQFFAYAGTSVPGGSVPEVSIAERRAREDALARARVFVPGAPEIEAVDLSTNPNDRKPFPPDRLITCRYVPKPLSGTTPKFDCALEDGEVVKVKYGRTPEISGEVGATRLLAALGFGADHVSLVERLRCIGCPPAPFRLRQVAAFFFLTPIFDRTFDYDTSREFARVAVERRFDGDAIEAGAIEGWQWAELTMVDHARGGASRADLDALRLMAVIIADWDNKSANQRLVCLDRDDDDSACRTPLLMLQDVGATFGPTKVNHSAWAKTNIWADEARCIATMESLPYHGATFRPVQISEAGRSLLAGKLRRLSDRQMQDLFRGADFPVVSGTGGITPWVDALKEKIRQVADRPPCPSGV